MHNNLKPRFVTIDGKEYELPPGLRWIQSRLAFRVQFQRNHGKEWTVVQFPVKRYGSVDDAYTRAKARAVQEREEGLKRPPFPILGISSEDKPLALGAGIYMQINTSKNNYQLLSVRYGSRVKGNFKRKCIGLGYAGYFTARHFDAQLKKAQELRKRWEREDAANEQQFSNPQTVNLRRST